MCVCIYIYLNYIRCQYNSLLTQYLEMGIIFQRGEAKLLTEDWEGAVADLKLAAEKSPQVCIGF